MHFSAHETGLNCVRFVNAERELNIVRLVSRDFLGSPELRGKYLHIKTWKCKTAHEKRI